MTDDLVSRQPGLRLTGRSSGFKRRRMLDDAQEHVQILSRVLNRSHRRDRERDLLVSGDRPRVSADPINETAR
ncbi:MAG TPA: hypothetical protein VFI46_10100 [Jiangellaceae bacterium]|nr:hypothetical protein [Jiangellaceae bacterium]